MTQQLQSIIDNAWEERTSFSPKSAPADVRNAVAAVLEQLNQGSLRVAQKDSGSWVVNQWVKKAVLLSFRLEDNLPMPSGDHMQFINAVTCAAIIATSFDHCTAIGTIHFKSNTVGTDSNFFCTV